MTRPSDEAIWASMADTLRSVVLPAIDDDWARQTVIQLAGLADYARTRPDDDHADRRERLRTALDSLSGNALVPTNESEPDEVSAAAIALTSAVGRDDSDAREVRAALRPLLLADLDADLDATEMLDDAFRGRLPDA